MHLFFPKKRVFSKISQKKLYFQQKGNFYKEKSSKTSGVPPKPLNLTTVSHVIFFSNGLFEAFFQKVPERNVSKKKATSGKISSKIPLDPIVSRSLFQCSSFLGFFFNDISYFRNCQFRANLPKKLGFQEKGNF